MCIQLCTKVSNARFLGELARMVSTVRSQKLVFDPLSVHSCLRLPLFVELSSLSNAAAMKGHSDALEIQVPTRFGVDYRDEFQMLHEQMEHDGMLVQEYAPTRVRLNKWVLPMAVGRVVCADTLVSVAIDLDGLQVDDHIPNFVRSIRRLKEFALVRARASVACLADLFQALAKHARFLEVFELTDIIRFESLVKEYCECVATKHRAIAALTKVLMLADIKNNGVLEKLVFDRVEFFFNIPDADLETANSEQELVKTFSFVVYTLASRQLKHFEVSFFLNTRPVRRPQPPLEDPLDYLRDTGIQESGRTGPLETYIGSSWIVDQMMWEVSHLAPNPPHSPFKALSSIDCEIIFDRTFRIGSFKSAIENLPALAKLKVRLFRDAVDDPSVDFNDHDLPIDHDVQYDFGDTFAKAKALELFAIDHDMGKCARVVCVACPTFSSAIMDGVLHAPNLRTLWIGRLVYGPYASEVFRKESVTRICFESLSAATMTALPQFAATVDADRELTLDLNLIDFERKSTTDGFYKGVMRNLVTNMFRPEAKTRKLVLGDGVRGGDVDHILSELNRLGPNREIVLALYRRSFDSDTKYIVDAVKKARERRDYNISAMTGGVVKMGVDMPQYW